MKHREPEAAESILLLPPKGLTWPNLAELWHYRELLYFLTWRDIQVRYKQTGLGIAWAVLQPVLTMAVFSFVFGRLARIPSDGVPYPVFAFCGLLPWQLFSCALTRSAESLVANERLVSKVYFPRIIIPLAALLAGVVDFSIAFVVLLVLMIAYGISPGLPLLALPFLILLALAAAAGVGLGLSALNVRFRDVKHALPFLAQFWMFATPIAYPASLLSERWRPILGLNPLAGVAEGFRWALLGTTEWPGVIVFVSVAVVVVVLAMSLIYFARTERSFADVI
jgi:lipopolysaccharide transport system permease protein